MLEPFIWMFRIENFGKYISKILAVYTLFFFVSIIFLIPLLWSGAGYNIINIVCVSLFFILQLSAALFLTGYFWNLTENIISREWDISFSNIYDKKKVTKRFLIELPQIKILKFIWRGVSSVVATFMLCIPFILLFTAIGKSPVFMSLPVNFIIGICIFFLFFIPAFLWNYALTDSVFAVWNLRKAIYIMGNHTFKYILNVLIFAVYYVLEFYLVLLLRSFLGNWQGFDILFVVKTLIILFILMLINLYSIHVYAYLLGTISPVSEDY